ncbi:hypothetical protein OAB44_01360 [Pelagibacteraceae bacterium]|nr:hypothetical protein [Pelagibacteraceae bacterium]
MKKVTGLMISFFILTGCAETMALLGPASTLAGGGNVIHSTASSAVSYSVKKKTGKTPIQHALAYAEEKNPNKKTDRCISFIKKTDSEACYIAKKQISSTTKSTVKKIKKAVIEPTIKLVKTNKTKQKIDSHINEKEKIQLKEDQSILLVKTKNEDKLKAVETMIMESVLNKEQINNLRVSIQKSSGTKDLSN